MVQRGDGVESVPMKRRGQDRPNKVNVAQVAHLEAKVQYVTFFQTSVRVLVTVLPFTLWGSHVEGGEKVLCQWQ